MSDRDAANPFSSSSSPPSALTAPPIRLASIDVYRGFVMFLLLAETLHFGRVATQLPGDATVWDYLARQQEHVAWLGCRLHDLIQPGFSFLVGVALPFSLANRVKRGQSFVGMTLHAFWRALVLVFLGIFLRSMGSKQTNFTFEDTLTQIGLGYFFLFLLGLRPARDHWIAFGLIVVGYWIAFAAYPLPPEGFDYAAVGVNDSEYTQVVLTGFAGHWSKNSNLAWAFDRWWMNLFPRLKPFEFNGGGYSTLSFIPTLGTMILGLIAGGILKSERKAGGKLLWLAAAGAIGLGLGLALGASGICPIVKRIWTPSWTIYSGGWCFLTLAGFYAVTDAIGFKAWAYPLEVIGKNSIAAYLLHWLVDGFVTANWRIHLKTVEVWTGFDLLHRFGDAYEPFVQGALTLFILWLILFWMHRRKIYLRI